MTKKEDVKALLWLLLYSFVLLFFLSPDSYLYDLYYHGDSACFFMCGKAWMNGMVPYVDFADSKGPLLWLIYGLGYLISHHSYVGVFWISILFYTVTLFAAYKLCRLFADKDVSAVSVAVLPLFFFCVFFHTEVKTEDLCYPFVMLSLYCTCRILKYRDSDANTYFKLSALMGVCSMCCALMKYNIGCMIMTLMAVVLYMAIRHKAGWQSFWGMALGFVAPAVPFVIYFLIQGNMNAFIQEYLLNTFTTIENNQELHLFIHSNRGIIIVSLLVFGLCYFPQKHKFVGYWLLPCFLIFILGLGPNTMDHYLKILLPFSIFFILAIAELAIDKFPLLTKKYIALCIGVAACSLLINGLCFVCRINKFNNADEVKENYYKAAYVMAQIEKPKVYNDNVYDTQVGMPAGALPAFRYWMSQTGAWIEMKKEREAYLKSGCADFVCVSDCNQEKRKEIEDLGYILYCKVPRNKSKTAQTYVFGRPGLKLPPEDFHVSQWDVWLKRNIFGI